MAKALCLSHLIDNENTMVNKAYSSAKDALQ
ncbi:succinyl-CoA--3-ketoacid-CoA transferase, partial [Kaistia algarum]